jgi:hypothetical protein
VISKLTGISVRLIQVAYSYEAEKKTGTVRVEDHYSVSTLASEIRRDAGIPESKSITLRQDGVTLKEDDTCVSKGALEEAGYLGEIALSVEVLVDVEY